MREMAVRLHITPGAYSKNERGLNFPGLDTLRCLTRDFDISMDWLIFEKSPMYNKEKEQREKELEQTVEMLKQTGRLNGSKVWTRTGEFPPGDLSDPCLMRTRVYFRLLLSSVYGI
jgi:transcriptional regulator with XRE-family HTH domain